MIKDILIQRMEEELVVTGRCDRVANGLLRILLGKFFSVRVTASTSSSILITTSVPQNSVLCPVL